MEDGPSLSAHSQQAGFMGMVENETVDNQQPTLPHVSQNIDK